MEISHLPDIYAELAVKDQRKKELEEQTTETHALLEDTINKKVLDTKQKKDSVVKEPMLINTWGGNPLAEASSYLKT